MANHAQSKKASGTWLNTILFSRSASLFSLLLSIVVSLLLMLYPQAVIQSGQSPDHWMLMMCMLGVTGGFVHGVGFVPRNKLARIFFAPLIAWCMVLGGIIFMRLL